MFTGAETRWNVLGEASTQLLYLEHYSSGIQENAVCAVSTNTFML